MKIFITLILSMLVFKHDILAQKDSAKVSFKKGTPEYYKKESKISLNAGYIMAGSGIALITVGAIMNNSEIDYSSDKSLFSTGAALELIGGLTTICSIPCFVMHFSQKNKANILFKRQTVSIGNHKMNTDQPSLTIQISL